MVLVRLAWRQKKDTPTRLRLPRETPRGRADVRAGQSQFHCRMYRSHRSGPVWKTPRNSGLCTATARPAMNVPLSVRTGEMLRCPGNNLRRYCSRTHRHASPHHRVTPFKWSLSLNMSQRRDNQMTDDRFAVGPCSACLPRPRSPRPDCWPKLETDILITANKTDNYGVNYSLHTPAGRARRAASPSIKTGSTNVPLPIR